MPRKLGLSVAVLLMSALPAQAAFGATITLNSTCSFAKAVAWINTPTTPQTGCTRSGSFGTNDTIIVGLNHQQFSITSTVEIKKSLRVQSWWSYGYLNVTNKDLSYAIMIQAKNISVTFNSIILSGVHDNNVTRGFFVDGRTDTTHEFTPKLTLQSSRVTGFRRSGIRIQQSAVKMSNTTLDYNSNTSESGGAVQILSGTRLGRLEVDGCNFVGNWAQDGGAIYNYGNLNVTSSYFSGNVATNNGLGTGGVVHSEHVPNMNYYANFAGTSHFEYNRADTGGYAIASGASPLATTEFSSTPPTPPNTAVGNTSGTNNPPQLCLYAVGYRGCPTQ